MAKVTEGKVKKSKPKKLDYSEKLTATQIANAWYSYEPDSAQIKGPDYHAVFGKSAKLITESGNKKPKKLGSMSEYNIRDVLDTEAILEKHDELQGIRDDISSLYSWAVVMGLASLCTATFIIMDLIHRIN